ncbi:uncharacterized protein DEA37_0013674 [Paragonimus westermani]|uniref:Reverse transcriptase domain-containing protein n=1 Tax=Paragonimus westermani TaxID=34504 RepID=A0A5J4NTT4_9TREM|nr:uncharacterized protein DEA37_0013674 [Paragonimus westermani]
MFTFSRMSSSDSSESELLVQALPAPDFEPSEPPDLEKALTSPEEYIRWVRYEASTYSDVMHTAVNSKQATMQESYSFSEPTEDTSESHELLLLNFEETVQEYRAFKSVISLEKNKERLSSKTLELFKSPPSLSWIANRSRADLGTLLEMVTSCCTKKNWNSALGALRESSGLGVELLPGARLTDLEYADDIVSLSSSAEDMQTMLNKVSDRAGLYGMHFAPSKCKVLLQDWGISTPTFFIAGNPLETVDSFTYLGSTISSACNIADEISARIAKARVAFSKLRHLWRRKDVRLSLKGRVYNACVRSILLYGSETWPVRKQDINRLAVFDHRCLRHLAHIKWADRVSNAAVRRRVFRNARDARSVGQLITLQSLRWLGHVLRMPAERSLYRALHSEATNSWVKPRGGQATTWSRNMKTLTAPLSSVSRHRLPGWGPRDYSNRWLETLSEMARVWIFALMVALEPPLHPDIYHSLRAIAKRCRKLKKDCEDVPDTDSLDLQFFDLCPFLVARGFGQLDILK